MRYGKFCWMIVLLLCSGCLLSDVQPPRFDASRRLMGTDVSIAYYTDDPERGDAAVAAAFKRIEELNAVFSDYDQASEVSELSRSAGTGEAYPVSRELWPLLLFSQDMARRSGGAFDVTVGPYVLLWRQARHTRRYPDAERLEQARDFVGYDKVELSRGLRAVNLTAPRMRLDFGAVAKGYAADEALRVMAAHGITSAMVDAGGDLALGAPPPGRNGWRIFIEGVREERGMILSRCGVATSGDRYKFVEIESKRYSHIIDPRTGEPISQPVQVTVIAPSCKLADALASAVSVLGQEEGQRLADSYGSDIQVEVYEISYDE